jgi:hypothetical protein
MMGVNMGYSIGPRPGVKKCYAIMPLSSDSGKTIWFSHYWKIQRRNENTFEIEEVILTEKEYFLWSIANPLPQRSDTGKLTWR